MFTIYLLGFAITFAGYWIFLSQKEYEESTDYFCSLVFSFAWPLWFILSVIALVIYVFKKASKGS